MEEEERTSRQVEQILIEKMEALSMMFAGGEIQEGVLGLGEAVADQ